MEKNPNNFPVNGLSKQVTLIQEPNEIVSVEISTSSDPYNTHRTFAYNNNYRSHESRCLLTYNLTLTFENNLHEISQDYGYEIIFKAFVGDENNVQHHIPLFSHKGIRTQKSMTFTKQRFCIRGFEVPVNQQCHVCCGIHRFNTKPSIPEAMSTKYPFEIGEMLFKNGVYSSCNK